MQIPKKPVYVTYWHSKFYEEASKTYDTQYFKVNEKVNEDDMCPDTCGFL